MDEERENVVQQIQTSGGTAVGGSVHTNGGDFAGRDINIYYANMQAFRVGEATVRTYLEQATVSVLPGATEKEEVHRLWQQPFRGHEANVKDTLDLYEAIQQVFVSKQERNGFQRLVLLADAGMGKTPALFYVRSKRAEASLQAWTAATSGNDDAGNMAANRKTCVIPLYIKLIDLHTELPLTALIRDAFNSFIAKLAHLEEITLDQVEGLLFQYTCLFLLDDLDAIHSDDLKGGVQALSQFMETNQQHQFVISCRSCNYRQQLGAVDILYLDDLSEDEARAVLGEYAYGKLSRYLQQLVHNRAMLKILLNLGESAGMSQTKGQLVQLFVRQLLDPEKDAHHQLMHHQLLAGLLAQIAICMQYAYTHHYSERQLMKVVAEYLKEWNEPYHWREIVDDLVAVEMLKQDDRRQWSFRDRTTEAYFAAIAIVHEPTHLDKVLADITNHWWRDTLEILVGLWPKPKQLFFELIDRDALVAANCIEFGRPIVDRAVEDDLIDALIERMGQESSTRRKYIVERIGESNQPRAAEALLVALEREWSSLVIMAIVKGLKTCTQRNLASLKIAEEIILHSVLGRGESLVELLQLCETPGHEVELTNVVKNLRRSQKIRGVAAIGLGIVGTAAARQALLNLFQTRNFGAFVDWCVVEALTQLDYPEVQVVAYRIYQTKKRAIWALHRARAIYLLGWMSRQPETGNVLDQALTDTNPFVRGYAIGAMAKLDLIDAREKIERLFTEERDSFVLGKAAEALGHMGTVDSIAILERYLRYERDRTRWTARKIVRKAIFEIKQRYSL